MPWVTQPVLHLHLSDSTLNTVIQNSAAGAHQGDQPNHAQNDPRQKSPKGAGELLRTGTPIGFEDKMIEFDDFNALVGPPSIRDAERHYYAGVEDTQRRAS